METIRLNKQIYKLEALQKAVAEFKELAMIKVSELDKYFVVEFENIDNEYQGVIKDEFANYVLGLLS